MPSSRGSSQPRNWTHISRIAGRLFTIWATREVWLTCPDKSHLLSRRTTPPCGSSNTHQHPPSAFCYLGASRTLSSVQWGLRRVINNPPTIPTVSSWKRSQSTWMMDYLTSCCKAPDFSHQWTPVHSSSVNSSSITACMCTSLATNYSLKMSSETWFSSTIVLIPSSQGLWIWSSKDLKLFSLHVLQMFRSFLNSLSSSSYKTSRLKRPTEIMSTLLHVLRTCTLFQLCITSTSDTLAGRKQVLTKSRTKHNVKK